MNNVKKVIISDFLGTFTVNALLTYAYWYLYNQTRSQITISMLGTLSMTVLLFAFIGGYLTDQYSKIRLLRIITTLRLCIMLAGITALLFNLKGTWIIFGVVILDSLLGIVYAPLIEAITPVLVSDHNSLITANSWVSAANQVSSIASSALAVLFVYIKWPLPALTLATLSGIISLLALAKIPADSSPHKKVKLCLHDKVNIFFQGLKLVINNPIIKFMIPIAIITNFCYWSIWLLMPKLSIDTFYRYKYTYNMIDLSFTLGGILGATYFSKFHHTKLSVRVFPYLFAAQSLMLVFLGLNSGPTPSLFNVVCIGIAWIGYGIFNSIFSIIYFSIVQMSAAPDKIGLVIGAVLTIFSISNPIAAILNAPLSHIAPLRTIIIFCSCLMLIASLPAFSRRFRKELEHFDQ